MENLDIIILNIIVIICFITFFVSTFTAFENAAKLDNPKINRPGIISRLFAYLQSLLND